MTQKKEFKRALTNSQIQLIALGGTIGTGLFLGIGDSIHRAGPSIILIYLIIGIMIYLMLLALGELILSNLKKTTYIDFISQYLSKNLGLTSGYLYWFAYIFLAMTQISALGIYFKFWFPYLAMWIPGLITIGILLLINLTSTKFFGNLEFSFSIIKILTIICFVLFAAYLLLTSKNTQFGQVSFNNLFNHGGFFSKRIFGFLAGFQMAIFSFVGVEMIGLTAAETKDPKNTLPKAISQMAFRIVLFYVLAIIAILVIIPWNKVSTANSPFVQALQSIGINNSAAFLNIVVISAAVSSINSILYSAGRLLFSISQNRPGFLNRKFATISNRLLPQNALIFSAIIIALAPFLIMLVGNNAFNFISAITTSIFILIWLIMIVTHLKYRKITAEQNGFHLPGAPYTDYVLIIFFALIIILLLAIDNYRLPTMIAILLFFTLIMIFNFKTKKEG